MVASNFFHSHVHSEFSVLDGMSSVKELVRRAVKYGQPALAATEHGNMASVVQLYKECRSLGILPYAGVEAYLVPDHGGIWDSKAKRYHIGILALDFKGYQALIKMVSKSYTRPQFSRFPRIDWDDLTILSAHAGEHVAVTTGCYFGLPQQTLVSSGEREARAVVSTYASLFPNLYVELQNHNIDHGANGGGYTDATVCDSLFRIAQQLGLPVVITQDAHYSEMKHKEAHALMKRMVYGGQDDEFPGDSFHLASTRWVQRHHSPVHWAAAQEGFADLLERHKLALRPLDKYQANIPSIVQAPYTRVSVLCRKKLAELKRQGKLKGDGDYDVRLTEELDVIHTLGLAGYFVLVRKIVRWCEDNDVFVEARGSANGSLVCFLLGITQVDPIQWGTIFERFLSRDRVKPADIDLDVEDIARDKLIAYIKEKYSTEKVVTFSKLGMNDEGKGSVFVTYMSSLRKKMGDDFKEQKLGLHLKSVEDVKDYFPDDYEGLKLLSDMDVRKSYGVHASAILITTNHQPIDAYVPTMIIPRNDTIIAGFTGDDLDELGYCKVDVLGAATLTALRVCQKWLGHKDPTDFSWIPEDDKPSLRALWEGRRDTGIFHFEAPFKSREVGKMRPTKTMDLCLAQALFMPGAITSGQTDLYLQRRASTAERQAVKYIHPAWEAALKSTYGAVIFQEQVIDIMRRLGMSIASINTFFKVVKDSGAGAVGRNAERLSAVRAEFDELCRRNGITDVDIAWESTAGFVSYGFNRAHATGYGLRSYRCAYLKTHHPVEFMAALLFAHAGADQEPAYVNEVRRLGIPIVPPDINKSGEVWGLTDDHRSIRKGLSNIKGVGLKAATSVVENAPYTSLTDLIQRTNARHVTGGKTYLQTGDTDDLIGVLKLLKEYGAMQSIGIGRFE